MTTFARGSLTAVTSIILPDIVNIVIIVDVVIIIAACGPLVRGFAKHFIAPPSILRAARASLRFSLFHVYLPLHLSAAALYTLSPATNPRHRTTRVYPHDFPYPHPPSLTPRTSATFCTRFLYLLREFTDNTTARSRWALRSSVLGENPLSSRARLSCFLLDQFAIYVTFFVRSVFREYWDNH